MSRPVDHQAVVQVIRVAERIIDLQVAQYEQHLKVTADLVRLGVASLGGVIAIVGLVLNAGVSFSVSAALGVTLAVVLLAASTVTLVLASGGRQTVLQVGPDVRRAFEVVDEGRADLRAFNLSVARAVPEIVDRNSTNLARLKRLRVGGFWLMVLAVGAFLVALALIAGGPIRG